MSIISTATGYKVILNEHEPAITDQDVKEVWSWVKSNRRYFFPTISILAAGIAVGTATAVSLAAVGVPPIKISHYLPIPPLGEIAGFLNITDHKAIAAVSMLDPAKYNKGAAISEGSGKILLDILVIGCFGGIISAVLSAAGQKNIAVMIGFVATMVIILKVVDLVNTIIDKIGRFLGMT